MDRCRINIGIMEPSHIIYEGLSGMLLRSGHLFQVFRLNDIYELKKILSNENLHAVIINPSLVQSRFAQFQETKKENININWLALVYAFFDNELLTIFDNTISINETAENLCNILYQSVNRKNSNTSQGEQLSQREIEVLIQMAQGLSIKEIADKLNISSHTVISHRKNISQKTGIKSQAGLAIYAVTNKIITLED